MGNGAFPMWLLKLLVEVLSKVVTDDKIEAFKALIVEKLRAAAKETPDFPLDDVAVEFLARFLGVK